MQKVRIGDVFSEPGTVRNGVPPGSILGPVLFLIFINDLPNVGHTAKFTLFADDATLTFSDKEYHMMIDVANSDLLKVHQWTLNYRLMLNTNKTSAMLFTNRIGSMTDTRYNLCNESLNYVDKMKFLCIIVYHKLNFSSHIEMLTSKLSKIAGILYSVNGYTPENILINLYYSLIYQHLIYGKVLWGGYANVLLEPLNLIH